MNTKHQLSVSVQETEVKLNGHWVKGDISTLTALGETGNYYDKPHITKNLDVSVWLDDDGDTQVHIDQNLWVHLSGIMGEGNYSRTEIMRTQFTLAELSLISSTLTAFLEGVKTGEISPK